MNLSPIVRSRQFQPSPSCFMAGPQCACSCGTGAFAQHVETAAVGAFDALLGAEIEVHFGMAQRAAAAVAGYAVGVDGDGFERLGHDHTPWTPADDSRRFCSRSCSPRALPSSFRRARRLRRRYLTADRYVAADGTALPLAVWPAAGGEPPTAVILGLHGFGDYRDAFEEPAKIWAAAGITTYAYDQRGFGKSPTRGPLARHRHPGRRRDRRRQAGAGAPSRRALLRGG